MNRVPSISPTQQCLNDYANCLADPKNAPPSCIPIFPAVDSLKVKTFARGMFHTGNNGQGVVFGFPGTLISNSSDSARTSTAANTATSSSDFQDVAWTYSTHNGNSPYSSADFSDTADDMQHRLVSACLRVRYAGTELNRGGTYTCLVTPRHENIWSSSMSIDVMGNFSTTRRVPITNDWVELLWFPIDRAELNFNGPFTGLPDNASMCIAPSSAANNQPFEFEVYGNFEIIGQKARGKTPSYVSPLTETVLGGLHNAGDLFRRAVPDLETAMNMVQSGYRAYNLARGYQTIRGSRIEEIE